MLNVYDLLNLDKVSVEDKIKNAIENTRNELKDLDVYLMCKVYSGILFEKLREGHAICRLIDTNDLGCNYQHQFILVNNGEGHYLVDLTYEQFGDRKWEKLLTDGYDLIDDEKFHHYIKKTTGEDTNQSIRDVFDSVVKVK